MTFGQRRRNEPARTRARAGAARGSEQRCGVLLALCGSFRRHSSESNDAHTTSPHLGTCSLCALLGPSWPGLEPPWPWPSFVPCFPQASPDRRTDRGTAPSRSSRRPRLLGSWLLEASESPHSRVAPAALFLILIHPSIHSFTTTFSMPSPCSYTPIFAHAHDSIDPRPFLLLFVPVLSRFSFFDAR